MTEIILENLMEILTAAAVMLLSVLGAWLAAKLGNNAKLEAIHAATQEAIKMAQLTVGELEQTAVPKLKEANADGKLSKTDIAELNTMLVTMTLNKMAQPSKELINAAAIDIVALIKGAGEAWINRLKT